MRERIVRAAVEVIAERGAVNATTKEIARAAGVSEGSLYNHFEGKADLIATAFRDGLASGIRRALGDLRASAGKGTVVGNVERLARAAIAHYQRLLPAIGGAFADPDVLVSIQGKMSRSAAGPLRANQAFAGYLEDERTRGRLASEVQPASIASAVLGACLQYAFVSLLVGEAVLAAEPTLMPPDPATYARSVVRSILAGWTV